MGDQAASARTKLGDLADSAGLRRVHILAWRDLDDVEAGGSEVHAAEIAARWAAAGIDVLMRTSHAQGHLPEVRRDGYRVVRRGGRHLVFLDAPVQELLRRGGGRDGLLEVWNGVPFFTPLWARGPRVTFVHHVHADMWRQVLTPGLARVGEAIELRLAPRLYQRARVLTPSESSRQEIVQRLHLPADNVTAVPNGVDGRFSPRGARAPVPTILTVGRLVPHKRVDDLIRAAATTRATVPDLELVIAGEGYEREHLEALVAEMAAEAWVRFEGRVTDEHLVDLYRQAWLLASASSAEGWGMTITEAGACRTTSVATRISGHADIVDHDRSGLLVDSMPELAEAMTAVLTDEGRRERLAAGALARSTELSWDRTARDVLAALAAEATARP
jgi:glycosyltransferase involved in cell wall biosynthesis